jgi:prostaglandin-H2 D-isomerase / glutathione transferase
MSISLTYFDFDGSRGLECRLALTAAGVDFEDVRIKREQWMALKPTVPFGALPVLTIHGAQIAQCNAILSMVGRNHGMHPTEPLAAAKHDMLMCSVEDLRHKVPGGRDMSDEEKKEKREAFAAGFLAHWAASAEAAITGPFLEGDTLNVADIKLYVIMRSYYSDTYDFIPSSHFDGYPKLKGLFEAVGQHPAIAGYFEGR